MALTQADLQAISQLMEPLQVDIQDMKIEMQGLTQKISSLESHIENETDKNIQETAQKLSSLESHIENETDKNIQETAQRLSSLELHIENETDKNIQETAQRLSSLELHIENETDKNIQLLAENHSDLIHKLNRAIDVHRNDIIFEIDISSLKERVSRIEKNCANRK